MRDRTNELRGDGYRSGGGSPPTETKKLMKNEASGDHNVLSQQELFFQKASDVRQKLQTLDDKVSKLEVMQNTILGTPLPDESSKKTLQLLREEIQTLSKGIRNALLSMEPSKEELKEELHDVNLRIRKTQHGILSKQFSEAINRCNTAQSHYRDRNVRRIHRQLEITGVDVTDEKLDEMLESGQSSVFTSNILKDMELTKEALNEIEARHGEILKLEKSIQELSELFKTLSEQVEMQGEMIDRIDKNISTSSNYVERAKEQLETAIVNKKKSRKKKIMIGICVGVTLLILIAIIASLIATG